MPRLLSPPKNLIPGIKEAPLDMTTSIKPGWFGYMDDEVPVIEWTHCRDIFQSLRNQCLMQKGMWYCHKKGCADNLCAFLDQLESILKIKKRSYLKKTNEENIIWIQPSPFWITDFIRRSFFTLALRCGVYYKRSKNNFLEVFNERAICVGTIPAIKRFLDGYTLYPLDDPEYNTYGWQYTFFGKNESELQGMLIKGR